ncbi:ankyrin repeat domain-containing protein [Streptomyces sp. NPDC060194]|uniref:ankyrin repeat domain-containing protein n=1 Tax=Streptomyces sp. NPDC060194 TaxID=3347069 RepID=UPI0036661C97
MTHDPSAALTDAVDTGDEDLVLRLLRSGADPEGVGEDGETPLYRAAVREEAGCVRLLLAAGAHPDRPSGVDADELPLCAAAVSGDAGTVRALLAGGARPDLREGFGFTALVWAAQLGHTEVVAALLAHGASPDLGVPGGDPPLVLATRRGSVGCVRALLGAGAGGVRAALAEALRWAGLDAEGELRRVVEEGASEPGETVVRRFVEAGGVTLVAERFVAGRPVRGAEQQTGHAAIATLLEEALGVRVSFAALAERALRCGDPRLDGWTVPVRALRALGDEETLRAALVWCGSDDPLRQTLGAEVLAGLGLDGPGRPPFAARALGPLLELADRAEHDLLLAHALTALAAQHDPAAVPALLRHAGSPSAPVRRAVAAGLGVLPFGAATGAAGSDGRRPAGRADGASWWAAPTADRPVRRDAPGSAGSGSASAAPGAQTADGAGGWAVGGTGPAGGPGAGADRAARPALPVRNAPGGGGRGSGAAAEGGPGATTGADPVVAPLIVLSRDPDDEVRAHACAALARPGEDSPAVRSALADLRRDPRREIAARAALGLALRQDVRCIPALEQLLADEPAGSPARVLAASALPHLTDDHVRARLSHTTPRRPVT